MGEWFEKRTLGSLPAEAARRWGEREALYFAGQRWNYREFSAAVDRAAKGLLALGIEPGEKVALWMTNRPQWLFILYAVAKIGAVLVPLNTRYRTDDLTYAVRQSGSSTLIAIDQSGPVHYMDMVAQSIAIPPGADPAALAVPAFPVLKRVIFDGARTLPGTLDWADVLASGDAIDDDVLTRRAHAVNPDAIALICYTSGTTGDPKGVMHNHIFVRNVQERAAILGIACDDVHLTYLPMFHIYALSEIALASIMTGAKQVMMEIFDPDEALRLVEQEGVTWLHGFDTHWKDLMGSFERQPVDVSTLRLGTFPSGTDPSIPVCERAQDMLCPTVSGFGMTETWAFVAVSHPAHTREQRVCASGRPMPDVEMQIRDIETGDLLPSGTPGELVVRGYTIMAGYYDKPEATAEVLKADGWLHTGDMAMLREDGHLVFLGRYKDMLKVGGENVSPAEVEAYLMKLPGIAEVSVVAYPDPRLAEVPVAFVIKTPGAVLSEVQIRDHLQGRIASFKIPRHVIFVDAFPMTSSGKVQKAKLRAGALARLGDTAAGD